MDIAAIRAGLPTEALMTVTGLPFKKIATGKVREIFDAGEFLLIIATDRLSAFDVVMPNGVPGKGELLTRISLRWFEIVGKVFPHHLVPDHANAVRALLKDRPDLVNRAMLCRKMNVLPVEAVVRGYLAGSGLKEYRATGEILGHKLPAGLVEGSKLPHAIFTPSTKAAEGHDEPITEARCAEILGDRFDTVRDASLTLYKLGNETAAKAGLILADTKFEFGTDASGKVFVVDEVLTPDSSRYWNAAGYAPGKPQPSYDKQFVRDWLEAQPWAKTKIAPGPVLPAEVVKHTQELYLECLAKLAAV